MENQNARIQDSSQELETQIQEHIQKFQDWAKKGVTDTSADNYSSSVKRFYKETGRIQPIQLGTLELERITEEITEDVTSRSMKFGLKKYFDYLSMKSSSVENERTADFVIRKLAKLELEPDTKNRGNKVISANKVSEISDRANNIDAEFGLLIRMMYETGTRVSGMRWLLWKDVLRDQWRGDPLKPHQIFISKNRSKGEVDGIVEVSDRTLEELTRLREERNPDMSDHVFFPKMTRPSVYQKVWRLFKPYPKNTTPHSFRHSRLTHLGLEMHQVEELDYPVIKERLKDYARHKQSETTEIYIEIVKQKLRQENQNMDRYRSVEW